MTHLLYQTDSYLTNFNATLLQVDIENHALILDQTAFYPGGGGQPCDIGVIKVGSFELQVIKVRKSGEELFHFVDASELLPEPGVKVTGTVNWENRYKLMRTHTALHILCGVVFRDYGAQVTGGDMSPLEGRMDFEFETMQKELVQTIEAAINEEVHKNLAVRTAILPREEAFQIPDLIRTKINLLPPGIQHVRVVEIMGLDLQADGGTHVRSTGEVGRIHVVDYKSKGKINKRIYIRLGETA
jgi:misacylated tRNA(Ala) deacylase